MHYLRLSKGRRKPTGQEIAASLGDSGQTSTSFAAMMAAGIGPDGFTSAINLAAFGLKDKFGRKDYGSVKHLPTHSKIFSNPRSSEKFTDKSKRSFYNSVSKHDLDHNQINHQTNSYLPSMAKNARIAAKNAKHHSRINHHAHINYNHSVPQNVHNHTQLKDNEYYRTVVYKLQNDGDGTMTQTIIEKITPEMEKQEAGRQKSHTSQIAKRKRLRENQHPF